MAAALVERMGGDGKRVLYLVSGFNGDIEASETGGVFYTQNQPFPWFNASVAQCVRSVAIGFGIEAEDFKVYLKSKGGREFGFVVNGLVRLLTLQKFDDYVEVLRLAVPESVRITNVPNTRYRNRALWPVV
ncbi:hypothetical protein A2397_00735 [Candidatus Amesbacteria bacterium RIFOXYB1_FULL_44_23]|uniref:Uncharacterized protein n=1 Tax=Candidatus Amesbacteria bacterium RIFOXYB1_FULL_44_23 TaxID=1797263 RepID=A0A1F4ZS47_9BACT|nr:MAG: hypothetical protein A2397_00735 [Candidatus Amesbacteria bacterium RIFOXYB1_FULL_44_23]